MTEDLIWAEALRLRKELDLVNAIELFDRLSGSIQAAHEERQRFAISQNIPSFFSSFLPKSGGTFLHNRLINAGAVEIPHHTQSPIDFLGCSYLIPSWLRVFLDGGASCHTHFPSMAWNLRIINEVGVQRIWLHLRDPRQAALSAYWHGQGVGQGSGDWETRRLQNEKEARDIRLRRVGDVHRYDKPFDVQIRENFDRFLCWITSWLMASKVLKCDMLFTTYEKMLTDRSAFEKLVLRFHGSEHLRDVFEGEVSPKDRFRRGLVDEWRTVVDAETCEWMSDRMPQEVLSLLDLQR